MNSIYLLIYQDSIAQNLKPIVTQKININDEPVVWLLSHPVAAHTMHQSSMKYLLKASLWHHGLVVMIYLLPFQPVTKSDEGTFLQYHHVKQLGPVKKKKNIYLFPEKNLNKLNL